MADYKTPQWLLPNEKNLAYPAAGAETGSGLSEDRHSLYSMDFNSGDYISANNTFLNSSTEFSISFWAKLSNASLNIVLGDIITPYSHGFSFNWAGGYEYVSGTVGTIIVRCQNGSSSPIILFPFAGDTNWHHFAVTYKTGTRKLYVNGSLSATNASGPSSMPATLGNTFKIGIDNSGGSNVTNGKIDEVAIFNTELTANEVQALSTASAPANIMALNKKPIAYYPLGEQAQMGSANWSFPNGSLQSHAVSFDGSTDYISAGSLSYVTSNVFTISGWIKATTSPPTYMPLFNFQNSSGIGSKFGWNHGAAPILWYSGSTYKYFLSGSWRTDGLWHNVVLVIDRTTIGNSKLYVDGDEISGGTTSGSGSMVLNDLYLGYNPTTQFYDGEMSNVAIWNSDQSANLNNIYNNGSPQSTYTVTPTALWKLNAANSSYVYPWSLELNGNPDVSGGADFAKVVSNALQVQDIDTTGTSGKVDFLTREITGAYSGIDVTGEFIVYAASSGQCGATLYYKIDGGSWVQFQQELRTDNTATTYAISGASGLTSTTSFQVKIEFETGSSGTPYVTLNNISIGGLYTEDFTNQDGAGWDLSVNSGYIPPPVDWTFIDTETPAPNYTSALDFNGSGYITISPNTFDATNGLTMSCWVRKSSTVTGTNWLCSNGNTGGVNSQFNTRLASGDTWFNYFNGGSTYTGISGLGDGRWHHIAQTVNYSTGDVMFYKDGVPSSTVPTWGSTYAVAKLSQISTSFYPFEGDISNFAIFSSALSTPNIVTLYNNGTPEVTPSFSPTSWWKLDNTTTGIQDSGSASNNGINNGATQIATNVLISNNGESDTLPTSALTPSDLQFESPYSNYSLSFDGTNHISLTANSTTQPTTAFSLSLWAKWSVVSGIQGLISNGANNGYMIWSNGTTLQFYIYRASGGWATATSSVTLTTDTWFHIAATWDGSDISTIYVDGVNTGIQTGVTIPTYSGTPVIGKYITNEFSGKMDEVAIWSSALTQAQIIQVYNNGYPANIASLSPTSWWRLGEDAYFVGNDITIPNQITGGPTGTGSGTQTAILVGDAPGSYANGSGTNLVVTDRIGDAPESTANSVSINMIPSNRHSYPAGYTPTQVDNAFSMAFDGISDYFSAPITALNSATVCSISFWGKKDASNKELVVGGSIDASNGIWIQWYTDGNIYFSPRGSGAGSYSLTHAQSYDSNWHHYVGVYDGTSAANCKLYLDGNLVATGTGTPPSYLPSTTGDVFQIGALGTSFYTTGNIDEVAIFNYALSERQVKQDIYNGTTTGKTADLNNISNLTAPVAWYRMGD